MKRSRVLLILAMAVVAFGVMAGLGAWWLNPARAAVGPLAGEALILPADARFVMGFDVKRFASSEFYARFAKQHGLRPDALQLLEEKTGLNPTRDIDQIVVAGSGAAKGSPGIAVAIGRFDLYRLGRAIETDKKGARGANHEGVTIYTLAEVESGVKKGGSVSLAFLDERTLVFGPKPQVLSAISARTRGETPLKTNAELMARVEQVRPGSTFWMVGDQSLLAGLPSAVAAPGASPDSGATLTLPALVGITVTGDLDPQLAFAVTGEARDALAAKNLADVVRGFVAMASLQAQQKPELQELASAISVTTDQNRVLVNARIPYELLEALQPKKTQPAAPAPGKTTASR